MRTYFLKRSCDDAALAIELAEHIEAWRELRSVAGDLVANVLRGMPENARWSIEIQDGSSRTLHRISLAGQTLARVVGALQPA